MRILTTLFAATLITGSLQAATPKPAVQSGPYFWTTGTYQYDGAGNIKTIGTHTFTYDPLSRLTMSHVETPDTVSDQTFTYDSFGNMIRQTTSDLPTLMPTDVTTNHLDPTIAGYDDAGDVTQFHPPGSPDTYGFTYDALGSVSAQTADGVTVSYFVYTPDDERLRIENTTSGTKHWRVRNLDKKVLRDVQLSGSTPRVYREYVYRGGSLLAAITPTTVEHFSTDHLGSPRLISDIAGNKLSLHTYLPYGKELGVSAADGEPMKFTAHERDDDPAGGANPLDYMHARYYSPGIARFLSVDQLYNNTPQRPASWNRFVYGSDNPIARIDPDGLRDVYVSIWRAKAPFVFGNGSVGHAAVLETNGKMILSQFPSPHLPIGRNVQKDLRQTIDAEGRNPDVTFKIHLPNDQGFDGMARTMKEAALWKVVPGMDLKNFLNDTNCVNATELALVAGGLPLDRPYLTPGGLANALQDMARQPQQKGQQWSVEEVSSSVIPGVVEDSEESYTVPEYVDQYGFTKPPE